MIELTLQHLERLSPRDVWTSEAIDFTPWLARAENFAVLAETLHFADAEVEAVEKAIGSFSADIVARDREGYVLVENQLEQTDHGHLGQIITYLAGLEGPVKVVWLTTKVREEHRAAVDWLNAHTPDEFSFFAVELELFRIGTSPVAPHFSVVAKPNDWSRHVTQRSRQLSESATSEQQKRYMKFWEALGEFLAENDPSFSRKTPPKGHWWTFGIGRTGFSLILSASARDHWINAAVVCREDAQKLAFDHFLRQREEIEAELGEPLHWHRVDDSIVWDIALEWRGVDPMDAVRWPEYFAWYWEKMQKLRRVFTDKIRAVDFDQLRAQARAEDDGASPT